MNEVSYLLLNDFVSLQDALVLSPFNLLLLGGSHPPGYLTSFDIELRPDIPTPSLKTRQVSGKGSVCRDGGNVLAAPNRGVEEGSVRHTQGGRGDRVKDDGLESRRHVRESGRLLEIVGC